MTDMLDGRESAALVDWPVRLLDGLAQREAERLAAAASGET
jgi:hypothetical protein